MANIISIEGIGKVNAGKLVKAGIATVEALLEQCGSRKGRQIVAKDTGIDESKLLKWTNHADLCRIKGVAGQYAELLEAAGVDSVKELAKRKPENLAPALAETNAKKKLTRQAPGLKRVQGWIEQAKSLPGKVTH